MTVYVRERVCVGVCVCVRVCALLRSEDRSTSCLGDVSRIGGDWVGKSITISWRANIC